MARRIRWQIVIAVVSGLFITALLGSLALRTTSVAQPLAGGVYVEGIVGQAPQQVNPLLDDPQSAPVAADIGGLLFEGLMGIGPNGLPERALAQEWSVDESGAVYTFVLRRGLVWHDGTPLSADDVLFTIRAVQNRAFAGDQAQANVWRSVLVDKLDDYTIRCTLNAPYAPFLSAARLPILPAHKLRNVPPEQWASSAFSREPVGSGPYRLEQLGAERTTLVRNASYHGEAALIERIELRFFATPELALDALEREEIHALAYEPLSELRGVTLPPAVRGYPLALDGYTTLSFNLREQPLADETLRRALALGLNKEALIEQTLDGMVSGLDTPILPGWWAYDPAVPWHRYDGEAAARVLNELGYERGADGVLARGGQRLALPLITDGAADHVAAAQEIARQWGELGVQVDVQQLDGASLRARLRDHEFALALHSFSRLGPDPDLYELWHSDQAASGLNYAGLQDTQIDSLIASARGEFETALRSGDYSAFQEAWVEQTPAIMLYQPVLVFAALPRLGGLTFDDPTLAGSGLLFGRADRYRTIAAWYLNSSREIRGDLRQTPVTVP